LVVEILGQKSILDNYQAKSMRAEGFLTPNPDEVAAALHRAGIER
jgi:hypothetical protein